jgi:lysophospholipase L1-like esterase
MGASDDGKWLGVELKGRGIGLLNIETLETKRISAVAYGYGSGYDPALEIAVSNGGNQIAIMGLNAQLSVYDVTSLCGDIADDENMSNHSAIAYPCKQSPIDVGSFIYRFYAAFTPQFSDDGGELNFYATSYEGESREVTLRAAGNIGKKLDYLALGDSFTSGEGETDDKYYVPGTNDRFEKCHLSTRSYPYLLADLSNINPNMMKSVACSGATTKDVVGSDIDYWGQIDRLGVKGLKFSKEERVLSQTQAKYNFIPGRIHQETFVKNTYSKVITISVGGNDAGLISKLTACAGLGPTCNWANDPKKKEQTAIEIKNIYNKLVNTYKTIHTNSSDSKIYVVGYPNIIDPDGNCDAVTGVSLNSNERDFMVESVKYLNQVVKAAAVSAGVKYLDVQDSYGDQTLCGSKSPNANNGIRTGDDNNLINDSEWLRFIGNESFHPNTLGHNMIAKSIHESVDDLIGYSYCEDDAKICPNGLVNPPEPSSYWIPDNYHDYPTQHIANFVSNDQLDPDNRQVDLALDNYSLSPNSSVAIEITSDPIALGNFTSSSDGSLRASVILPIGLAEGYHTIHLYGTSYSGESIELYQVIKYEKPIVNSLKHTPDSHTNKSVASKIIHQVSKNDMGSTAVADRDHDYTSSSEVKGDSTIINTTKHAKISNIDRPDADKRLWPIYILTPVVIISMAIAITLFMIKKRK